MPLAQTTEQTKSELHIPGQFIRQLLYEADDFNELRVTLYVLWRLERMEGAFQFLRTSHLEKDTRFCSSLQLEAGSVSQALMEALQKGTRHGILLQAQVPTPTGPETIVCLNLPQGQALMDAIRRGDWKMPENAAPPEVSLERPNIFQLYEANIGPLTPMIADALRDAEKTYHDNWIEDAFQIAVERNKRSWHYIEAILHRWEEGGRDDRKDQQNRRDTEEARRRYGEWED